MEDSILNDIKKMLGLIDPEYAIFDTDIIAHINAAIGDLDQLGIGVEGFFLEDASQTWGDLLGEKRLGFRNVKQYVFLRTKLVFDPPTSGFVMESMNALVKDTEWRLNVIYEVDKQKQIGGDDDES